MQSCRGRYKGKDESPIRLFGECLAEYVLHCGSLTDKNSWRDLAPWPDPPLDAQVIRSTLFVLQCAVEHNYRGIRRHASSYKVSELLTSWFSCCSCFDWFQTSLISYLFIFFVICSSLLQLHLQIRSVLAGWCCVQYVS